MLCGVLVDVQQSPWVTLSVVTAMGLLNNFQQKFGERERVKKGREKIK
jgi:hypothetical protein